METFDLTNSGYYLAVAATLKRYGLEVLPEKFKPHYDTVVKWWFDHRLPVKRCAERIAEFGYMEKKP